MNGIETIRSINKWASSPECQKLRERGVPPLATSAPTKDHPKVKAKNGQS